MPEAAAPASALCCGCACASCAEIETHYDRHLDRTFRLYRCADCGLVFSEPRQAVGADWYQKAVPLETPPPAESDPRFAAFFRLVPGTGKVADIGCGEGGFLALAKARGWQAVGFDYDARKVDEVRRRGLQAHASDWEAFCAAQPEGAFDAVTLFDVLEHVPEPALLAAQVRRLLKTGGRLIVTLPNALRPIPFGREEFDFPPHHFTRWTPAAMKGFLERAGFEVIAQEHGRLEFGQFLEIGVLQAAVKPALKLAKKLLFSQDAQASVTELAADGGLSGPLGEKGLRRRLFSVFQLGASAILLLPCAALWLFYQLQPGRGTTLTTAGAKR